MDSPFLWSLTFSFLTDEIEVFRLGLVCKSWREAATEDMLWLTIASRKVSTIRWPEIWGGPSIRFPTFFSLYL